MVCVRVPSTFSLYDNMANSMSWNAESDRSLALHLDKISTKCVHSYIDQFPTAYSIACACHQGMQLIVQP
jgi:hypothetical protein